MNNATHTLENSDRNWITYEHAPGFWAGVLFGPDGETASLSRFWCRSPAAAEQELASFLDFLFGEAA